MAKTSVVVGLTLTTTQITAITLSCETFSVLGQAWRLLPSGAITHDSAEIIYTDKLLSLIDEVMVQLGHPQYDDPLYLCMPPDVLDTETVSVTDTESLKNALRDKIQAKKNTALDHADLLIECSILRQNASQDTRVGYAGFAQQRLDAVAALFYRAGYQIRGIEMTPLAVTYALAASGVLDALLFKHGLNLTWGCIGLEGSTTWFGLWHGKTLIHLTRFNNPPHQYDWQTMLLSQAASASDKPMAFWFYWHDSETPSWIDWESVDLNAPIRPATTGPAFAHVTHPAAMTALGAALKEAIYFENTWQFLDIPISEEVATQYATVPYRNYQPVLPKLILQLGVVVFLAILIAGLFFGIQNRLNGRLTAMHQNQLLADIQQMPRQNNIYPTFLSWITQKMTPAVQLDKIKIDINGMVQLSGKAYHAEDIETFKKALFIPQQGQVLTLIQFQTHVDKIMAHFDYTGHFSKTAFIPKASGPKGLPASKQPHSTSEVGKHHV